MAERQKDRGTERQKDRMAERQNGRKIEVKFESESHVLH